MFVNQGVTTKKALMLLDHATMERYLGMTSLGERLSLAAWIARARGEGAADESPGGGGLDRGRMAAVFCEGALGTLRVGYKHNGKLTWRDEFNAFVPVMPGFAKETAFSL